MYWTAKHTADHSCFSLSTYFVLIVVSRPSYNLLIQNIVHLFMCIITYGQIKNIVIVILALSQMYSNLLLWTSFVMYCLCLVMLFYDGKYGIKTRTSLCLISVCWRTHLLFLCRALEISLNKSNLCSLQTAKRLLVILSTGTCGDNWSVIVISYLWRQLRGYYHQSLVETIDPMCKYWQNLMCALIVQHKHCW